MSAAARTLRATEPETQQSLLGNYRSKLMRGEDGQPKTVREAIPLPEIIRSLQQATGGWPKRIGDRLFVDVAGVIRPLASSEALFAWVAERCDIQWRGGVDYEGLTLTPKAEFYEALRATVEAFVSVEDLPHQPQLKGSYYAWTPPAGYVPNGEALAGLLRFFDNAETDADRVLIRAMFLTPAWGGLAGLRPAFIGTAKDRGCGKTTLADTLGNLYGGAIDLEADEARDERLKSRLLSDLAMTKRVLRVDNVKAAQSSAQLEALITSPEISGHRLYDGESRRPNHLTVVITGNGVRLSRDLADRAFVIRLSKPTPRPGWNEALRAYLDQRRQHILTDIVAELRKPVKPTTARDRWQSWVSEVLARCTEAAETVVAQNQARRDDCDDDLEEAALIGEALRGKQRTFLTAAEACEAVNAALHVGWKTARATKCIRGHVEAGRLQGIEQARTMTSRGWSIQL